MKAHRGIVAALVTGLATTGLALAAAAGPAGAAPPVAAKATGEPVKLMVFGIFSGGGIDFSDVPDAAKAAAAALNKKNGIGGHPVQIVVCDQGLDPNKAGDCARQAVDDKVLAFVGAFSESEDYIPILEKAGIPSVAGYGIGFGELTSPISYPIGATIIGGTAGMGALVADQGAKKIDVSYLDIAGGAGKAAADFVYYGLKPRGIAQPTLTPEPTGGGDIIPSVQQTIDKRPDGVVLATTDPEFSKWMVAFRQAGGKAKVASTGSTVNPTNMKALGKTAEGVLVSANFKPASLTKDPGVKQMLKEIKAYDKGIQLVDGSIEAWAGVHLVADALEGQTTVDPATLMAQLNQDKTWDTRVAPPVNFAHQPPEIAAAGGLLTALNRVFTTDVYYAKVKNGKLVAIDGKAHNFLTP